MPGPLIARMPKSRCSIAGPAGMLGIARGTKVVRMESVVRHQNHRHIVAGISQERSEHLVVELVGHRDDVLIEVEVLLRDLFLLRRMITHEPMTEVVDRVVIDGEEIPRLILDQPGRGRVDADAFARWSEASPKSRRILV